MKKRVFAFLMILILLIIYIPYDVSAAEWPAAPSVSAKSAILIDADTGAVLYAKDEHATANPYGATALMTALLGLEKCSPSDTVTFHHDATHSYSPGDFNQGILTNEQLSVEQTIRCILMKSACEAAYGLGEHVSGYMAAFTTLMNSRAKELGALNTNFTNASGYAEANHYSTAYDLAMIARACFDNQDFMDISGSTQTYTIPATNKYKQPRYLSNSHTMLKGKKYAYEYCVGGKIGQKNSKDASNLTLVTFARKDNIRLICVLMGTENPSCYTDTTNLFDYAFNYFSKVNIDNASLLEMLSINNNTAFLNNVFPSNSLTIGLDNNLSVLLPEGISIDDLTISTSFSEDCFANVSLLYNNYVVGTGKLVAVANNSYNDNLPHITDSTANVTGTNNIITVNIWLIVAIIAASLIVIVVITYFIVLYCTKYGRSLKYRRY
ncbi:MAG: D-alanyl-D-alanine carboxypeptidase [Lachnospiraceae bacterium]|nr:D-alanyl-D-alanine carboxypeptidase [Lachnospiraceae bacterium]